MGEIALSREQALWVKASGSGQGVDVTAFATAHAVYHTGDADFTQQATFIPNAEKRNSRTALKPIRERFPPGSWGFPTYFKGTSNVGTGPQTDPLFLAAFGVKTVRTDTAVASDGTNTASKITVDASDGVSRLNTAIMVKKGTANYETAWVVAHASSDVVTNGSLLSLSPELGTAPTTGVSVIGSVTYSLIATSPGDVGVLKSEGHTSFRQIGVAVNTLTANVNGEGVADIEWGGEFMRQYISPTDALGVSLATAGVTSMVVAGSADRFMQGSLVKIGDEVIGVSLDPASSAVATVRGLVRGIKSTTATAHATGVAIAPWVPSSLAASKGRPMPGYKGYIELAGDNLTVVNSAVTLTNNTKMAVGEKDNSLYVTAYSNPNFRQVAGSLTAFFRTANVRHFQDATKQTNREFIIPVGDPNVDGEGQIASIQCRQINFETPALSGDEEREEAVNFTAFGLPDTNNDEIRVAFIHSS